MCVYVCVHVCVCNSINYMYMCVCCVCAYVSNTASLRIQSLRDKCWKARDEAAEKEKAFETKLQESYQQVEQRCKQVKTDTLQEARDNQKIFLQQLFPAVMVETETFPGWLDEFEKKVQEIQQQDSTQVRGVVDSVAPCAVIRVLLSVM